VSPAKVATWQQNVARQLPPIPAIPPEWREKQKKAPASANSQARKDGNGASEQ
jgi:hypothetical protein